MKMFTATRFQLCDMFSYPLILTAGSKQPAECSSVYTCTNHM